MDDFTAADARALAGCTEDKYQEELAGQQALIADAAQTIYGVIKHLAKKGWRYLLLRAVDDTKAASKYWNLKELSRQSVKNQLIERGFGAYESSVDGIPALFIRW